MMSDMDLTQVYFLQNREWYYYDDDAGITRLTEAGKKIPEVVASYKEYYNNDDELLY